MSGRCIVDGILCNACKEVKPIAEFRLRSNGKVARPCRQCKNEYSHRRYMENPERKKLNGKKWAEANRERRKKKYADWQRANKDARNKYNAEWRKKNPGLVRVHRERHSEGVRAWARAHPEHSAAKTAKRRATKFTATPAWANQMEIRKIYKTAIAKSKDSGIKHHVDHVVPLHSPIVCGLHCEANLEIVLARHNAIKSNKIWPDMP